MSNVSGCSDPEDTMFSEGCRVVREASGIHSGGFGVAPSSTGPLAVRARIPQVNHGALEEGWRHKHAKLQSRQGDEAYCQHQINANDEIAPEVALLLERATKRKFASIGNAENEASDLGETRRIFAHECRRRCRAWACQQRRRSPSGGRRCGRAAAVLAVEMKKELFDSKVAI